MPVNFPARNVYIAAKFKAEYLPSEFVLGDGAEYGGFTNRPLDRDTKYQVFLRAYTVELVGNRVRVAQHCTESSNANICMVCKVRKDSG